MNYHYHVNPKILKILSPEFRVILNRYPESLTIEIEVEKNLNILKLMGGFSSMEIWHALQTNSQNKINLQQNENFIYFHYPLHGKS